MDIELPYKIKQELWVLRKMLYIKTHEKIYIKKNNNYEEYQDKPVWDEKWVKECKYLKEYIINEDGLNYTFSNNEYLYYDGEDINLCENEVYIYKTEKEADRGLYELTKSQNISISKKSI